MNVMAMPLDDELPQADIVTTINTTIKYKHALITHHQLATAT